MKKTITSIAALAVSIYANPLSNIPNAPKAYPPGQLGKMVKLGRQILLHTNTNPLTKNLVGNKLSCVSCHLSDSRGNPGAAKAIGTLVGTAAVFPAYAKRDGTVQTLQDRIDNCFMRSMNGKRPGIDSKVSLAMAAYVTWLSQGIAMHMNPKRPVNEYVNKMYAKNKKIFKKIQEKATHKNYLQGKHIFDQKCAMCHGLNGEGQGPFPPLWGKKDGKWLSFNAGAGMSKLNKAPIWVKTNMPYGHANTLSNQQAADVVLYFDAQPRESFSLAEHLKMSKIRGQYNSLHFHEYDTVRKNFKALGLNIDKIRGDKVIK